MGLIWSRNKAKTRSDVNEKQSEIAGDKFDLHISGLQHENLIDIETFNARPVRTENHMLSSKLR